MVYVIMRVGLEWSGGGDRADACCPCATTAANRRTERLEQRSTGVTIASGTGDAADASRSRWGLQQPAVAIAAGRDSTRRAAVASETSDAADASRSRWGLQQPAVAIAAAGAMQLNARAADASRSRSELQPRAAQHEAVVVLPVRSRCRCSSDFEEAGAAAELIVAVAPAAT